MKRKKKPPFEWHNLAAVTVTDVATLARIYNAVASGYDPTFRSYQLKVYGDITKRAWYSDFVDLVRLLASCGALPREFIQAQFMEYHKPTRYSRECPTPKSMATPGAVDRWHRFRQRSGKEKPDALGVDGAYLKRLSREKMERLMSANQVTEIEFFQDPLFVSQLNRIFVETHPIYRQLRMSGFYERTFGVQAEQLFP